MSEAGHGLGHNPGETSLAELRSEFLSTVGGVMTEEAGAITGDLELLTRPTPARDAIEVYVRYAGAKDLHTVSGSPVCTTGDHLDAGEHQQVHQQAHGRILAVLTTPPVNGVEHGNEMPVDLRGE